MSGKHVSTQKTVIPLEWDKENGFNQWAAHIRNEVHFQERGFDACQIVSEFNKVAKYHKPSKK